MNPTTTDEILDALSGVHRASRRERWESAWRALWRGLVAGSVLLTLAAGVAAAVTSASWDAVLSSPAFRAGGLIVLLWALLSAVRSSTVFYVFEPAEVSEEWGWVFRSWSARRADIAEARVKRGAFGWRLELALRDGAGRRIVLLASMRHALGIAEAVSAESVGPTRG